MSGARARQDLTQHVPLGRTGRMVSRIGLASGYGVPTAAIEKAFHEHGINYFYVSLLRRGRMAQAIRHLARRHRDEMTVVLAKPTFGGRYLDSFVERWLDKLGIEQADVLMLQGQDKPLRAKLVDRVHRLVESGKTRFVGMSSHERPLLGKIARGEVEAPIDVFQLRYNAVHPGAEKDVFPHLPDEDRPGIVGFTATCWRKLLKEKLMPEGEQPLTAAECCRFVLSHPDVDVCITGPSNAEQLDANLEALRAGPLDEDEVARVRRIGQHIYNG